MSNDDNVVVSHPAMSGLAEKAADHIKPFAIAEGLDAFVFLGFRGNLGTLCGNKRNTKMEAAEAVRLLIGAAASAAVLAGMVPDDQETIIFAVERDSLVSPDSGLGGVH